MKTDITSAQLRKAYEAWSGPPVRTSKFRHGGQQDTDKIPPELDVLYFQPAESDNLPEEEYFTSLATAGMSTRTMPGSDTLVELVLTVLGPHPQKDLKSLGEALADLAVLPFQEEMALKPNLILEGISFPLFEGMTCALVTNWAVNAEETLPGLDPPVSLLSVKPIYQSEAEIIEKIGDVEANRRFLKEKVNWDDPQRPAAELKARRSAAKGGKKGPGQTVKIKLS